MRSMQDNTLRQTTVGEERTRGSLTLVSDHAIAADTPAPATIPLVLLSDDRLLCEGLPGLLRGQPDVTVLAACAQPLDAIRRMRGLASPVLLLDAGLGGPRILEAATQVRRESTNIRMIVIGVRIGQHGLAQFVQTGVGGFILKDAPFAGFLSTIREVAGGGVVMPPELAHTLFSQLARPEADRQASPEWGAARLTQRERQVVGLIRQGLSNKEIASRLNLAVHTTKCHVHNVLEKLSLRSRLEVAVCTGVRDEAEIY